MIGYVQVDVTIDIVHVCNKVSVHDTGGQHNAVERAGLQDERLKEIAMSATSSERLVETVHAHSKAPREKDKGYCSTYFDYCTQPNEAGVMKRLAYQDP